MLYMPLRNKNRILAQKSLALTRKRWHWLFVMIAMISLSLFGIVTAFGIAPSTSLKKIQVEDVVLDLSIPDVFSETESNLTFWRQESIRRGDTIAAILARLEINKEDTIDFLRAARDSKAMRQLRSGKIIYAQTTADGELLMLRYFFGNEELFLMEKVDSAFQMTEQQIELDARIRMRSGVVNSSLFATTDRAGVPNNVAMQITEIFSSDIDFHRDLHKGDRFTVVYETLYDNGEHAKTGRVLAVEFVNKGKSYQAVYFQNSSGEGGYYTPEGKSLRKEFLRSPLTFSRISSGFTKARFHPILKKWRAHKGIDYAAPAGTPVKATASGTVTFAGTQAGYGKLIILKHRGKYDTAYGHLSAFARGLNKGKRVNQGDIIGYVGSTGMATGPHLHYELRVDGEQRDPSKIVLPGAPPIVKKDLAAFHKETKSLVARLNIMRNINYASLN
ncbi:Murein DD-endopeptidase MepM and murein hydrolase activator NlpD, contain LysM domain [Nitrosomonas cryotolerans]|uniref:Murein DD-endopeptidase MepM and murein hydrolase activator NlpD, contain LysM domain n=2 Tax=Nitrosomonas cryotolerans TaxID=44575 RepID=A0A1N6I7H1_9PROT|nr:M23 family metallopeptidase [Nitrosomonas cryotolerans]SFP96978.1 Murein DD-endopeptidase MepM and murein hydrolase activator NlpD, contain LysM domain [Nitrosomonas cryotolerans]SIO27950.1 Murein DD-endopeptidase MepM and murein hydrolase activator NlpD, contain LysM domain [Nitrosomonas cryotolerans ATCC 49181]